MRFDPLSKTLFLFGCAAALFGVSALFAPAVLADDAIIDHVRGRIVLNVEGAGEAFYVSPADDLRYSLGHPDEAFEVMRRFGLGISNANLALIPPEGSTAIGSRALRDRLAGRIVLQVEQHGEAWYIDPLTTHRRYLGRPQDAFNLMRSLGLGMTREDLAQINIGDIVRQTIDAVPFYAQAPLGKWTDLRQQEGCEEASVLMAVDWARGTHQTPEETEESIITMSEIERVKYGSFIDTSAYDTYERLFIEQESFLDAEYLEGVDAVDVLYALSQGAIVLVPVNGTLLNNPYFQAGGPLRHMLVVSGYDHVTGEFITQEPGTARGQNYRYSFATFDLAMNDYETGDYAPLPKPPRTAMIVVVNDASTYAF